MLLGRRCPTTTCVRDRLRSDLFHQYLAFHGYASFRFSVNLFILGQLTQLYDINSMHSSACVGISFEKFGMRSFWTHFAYLTLKEDNISDLENTGASASTAHRMLFVEQEKGL